MCSIYSIFRMAIGYYYVQSMLLSCTVLCHLIISFRRRLRPNEEKAHLPFILRPRKILTLGRVLPYPTTLVSPEGKRGLPSSPSRLDEPLSPAAVMEVRPWKALCPRPHCFKARFGPRLSQQRRHTYRCRVIRTVM